MSIKASFHRSLFISLLLYLCIFSPASAQINVLRGPYLQKPTSSSMVLRWRTDQATDSRIRYGSSPTALTSTFDVAAQVIDHEIEVTGLQPFTKYYYSVGTSSQALAGGDSSHYFVTAPVPGTIQPIRAWAIGDFGKDNSQQALVRDSYLAFEGNTHTDLWLWLGDNAYDDGTDTEYQNKVFATSNGYSAMFPRLPFMPTPGNHDYGSIQTPLQNISPPNHTGPYYDIVTVPTNGEMGGTPSTMEAFYSYDYGNVHFVSANSEIGTLLGTPNDWIGVYPLFNIFAPAFVSSPFTQWLHDDLSNTDKRWKVVYFHQPPYTDGSHESGTFWEVYMEAMRNNITPILEQYGVDLVLCGHSHVYERSYLIKGHYDDPQTFDASMLVDGRSGIDSLGEAYVKNLNLPNGNDGTVYVVCGNGASKDDNPGLQYPAHYAGDGCNTCTGSFVLDVHGDTLRGRYLKSNGQIGDDFVIYKTGQITTATEPGFSRIEGVEVYPNPFSDQFMIRFDLLEMADLTVMLMDMAGKQHHLIFQGEVASGPQQFPVSAQQLQLSSGNYMLRIQAGSETLYENVVRMR